MTDPITVTIAPEPTRVRMLVTRNERDILKAVLAPATSTRFRAASTLLEGLSLWYQQSLSVVLCADERGDSSALGLYDALGVGLRDRRGEDQRQEAGGAQRMHRHTMRTADDSRKVRVREHTGSRGMQCAPRARVGRMRFDLRAYPSGSLKLSR